MMGRSVYLVLCLMLLSFFLCGCKTNKESDQDDVPQTKEERLDMKEWTKEEVIQYYWDHKESLQQIADALMSLDISVHFYVSGDGYRHSHNGDAIESNDNSSCQTVLNLLEQLDIMSVYYFYVEDGTSPSGMRIFMRNDVISQGLYFVGGGPPTSNCVHLEGDWYYFLEAET